MYVIWGERVSHNSLVMGWNLLSPGRTHLVGVTVARLSSAHKGTFAVYPRVPLWQRLTALLVYQFNASITSLENWTLCVAVKLYYVSWAIYSLILKSIEPFQWSNAFEWRGQWQLVWEETFPGCPISLNTVWLQHTLYNTQAMFLLQCMCTCLGTVCGVYIFEEYVDSQVDANCIIIEIIIITTK